MLKIEARWVLNVSCGRTEDVTRDIAPESAPVPWEYDACVALARHNPTGMLFASGPFSSLRAWGESRRVESGGWKDKATGRRPTVPHPEKGVLAFMCRVRRYPRVYFRIVCKAEVRRLMHCWWKG